MAGPISREDRERTMTRLKLGTVLLVGVSGGLITSQGEAAWPVAAAAVVGGLVVGAALVWFLFPDLEDLSPGTDREYRK
jgi:membrane associated rhomboid family serine protease